MTDTTTQTESEQQPERKIIALPVIDVMTEDFPLGKACDLSDDGTCEACQ